VVCPDRGVPDRHAHPDDRSALPAMAPRGDPYAHDHTPCATTPGTHPSRPHSEPHTHADDRTRVLRALARRLVQIGRVADAALPFHADVGREFTSDLIPQPCADRDPAEP